MARYERRYHRDNPGSSDQVRSPARRDRDRILYSIEFQRLSGVTQVASPAERFPVHNRLTHTVKVSQVGRAIAEELLARNPGSGLENYLDPDVVEAACLAHDLGHPPFGHNTERELDCLVWDPASPETSLLDGFEGNAQSFRIVTTTAVKYQEYERIPGLNLTAATLNALVKYPQTQTLGEPRLPKWGYYASEGDDFRFAREASGYGDRPERSLEANIMDVADDITYAVHDAEDFFRAGLLPLDSVASDSAERDWFLSQSSLDRARVTALLDGLALQRFQGGHEHLAQLDNFRSSTVDRFIRAISIDFGDRGPELRVADHVEYEISVLKELTRVYVIDSPAVQAQRHGQRTIVRTLFDIYLTEATKPALSLAARKRCLQIFPLLYQERIEPIPPDDIRRLKRIVADLIASMAENQIVDTYRKLTGHTQGSITDPLL